jgi:hypothetical protein
MGSLKIPTEADVRTLVYAWYRLLDVHAPMEQLLPLLGPDSEMVFPEATLHGIGKFIQWYNGAGNDPGLPGVVNIFFDEVHELKKVDIALQGTQPDSKGVFDPAKWRATAGIVVKWEAHRWKPPAAKSEYLGFDAWQRWILELSADGRPYIKQYIVDSLEPLQGSAKL